MNPAGTMPYPPAGRIDGYRWHPIRWIFACLAAMFVLIGSAIFLRLLFPGLFGTFSAPPGPGFPFDWLWALVVLVSVIWSLMWVVRGAVWMVRGSSHGDWHERRNRHDPALSIGRERYARGELTRDQYEQLRRDLN